jgi:hypothetical protein
MQFYILESIGYERKILAAKGLSPSRQYDSGPLCVWIMGVVAEMVQGQVSQSGGDRPGGDAKSLRAPSGNFVAGARPPTMGQSAGC